MFCNYFFDKTHILQKGTTPPTPPLLAAIIAHSLLKNVPISDRKRPKSLCSGITQSGWNLSNSSFKCLTMDNDSVLYR